MKKGILFLCAILFISASFVGNKDKINSLKTFAKAYGYVKYFHPSDEAANIDWNRFAAFGASEILKCENQKEVTNTLNELFKPIAPSVRFSNSKETYDISAITPENIDEYNSIYWQHRGVAIGMKNQYGTYSSVRINRQTETDESSSFGNLSMSIDPEKYKGKKMKYTAWAKLKSGSMGTGHLWCRVDKEDKTMGFFENMMDNPIKSQEWAQYEIVGDVDDLASGMYIGSMMYGKGTLYIDDVHLYYKENTEWIEIPLKNNDFEASQIGVKDEETQWGTKGKGYSFEISKTENKEGENCAVVSYEGVITKVKGEPIFDAFPKFGETINKEIGDGIFCQIPLNLYGNDESTFPQSSTLSSLQGRLDKVEETTTELSVRLGNIINTYNVFQHFYPYFDEVDVDWDKEFETALARCYNDQTENDHLITLQKMTAPLRDGHIWIRGGKMGQYAPPITWEWIEDELVITNVFKDDLNLQVGDVVTKIDNQTTVDYFKEVKSRISAGSEGWLNYRAQGSSLFGHKDTEITIEVNGEMISLIRDERYTNGETQIAMQKNSYKLLDENIYYLNLNSIEMDTITSLLPQLEQANGIICDLRGYPKGNHGFISHLLAKNDTSKAWMRIPEMIYPDQENITGYENHGWEMEAKEPYLGDKKVVFIIDGRAISYAESYMSFIEGYDLATIVGQPTAGANGNINPFAILGGFYISWTGMKVVKHDGSQHHTIGILPDFYVDKTIEGLKAGRDEFLEKAKEVILK